MKTYIKPMTDVIEMMREESLLATSTLGVGSEGVTGDMMKAPGMGCFDDEDEE